MTSYTEDMRGYAAKGGKRARTGFFHYTLRKRQQNNKGLSKRIWSLLFRISQAGSGCDISTREIGRRLRVPHISGIIISYFASIGDDCTIYQQVTIGQENIAHEGQAPTIGNNVYIGAGAKIIGPIKIGDNVRIGANAVVTKNVPSNCTVVGANRIIPHRFP